MNDPSALSPRVIWLGNLILGFLWWLVLWVTIHQPHIGIFLSGVAILVGVIWTWRAVQNKSHPWLWPSAVSIFLIATLGALIFANGPVLQEIIAVGSGFGLWWYLHFMHGQFNDRARSRVTLFVMTLTIAAIWLSLLSIGIFFNLAMWWRAAAAGGLSAGVASVVWLDAGLPFVRIRLAVVALALLGAEMLIATWWLPTDVLVGSVVATTTIMLMIQFCRRYFHQDWDAVRGRRYLFVGSFIILAVLLTARWQ